MKKAAAVTVGGIACLIPVGAGVGVLLDPLRRQSVSSAPVRVTTLEALPADGIPRKFTIIADRSDAWNKYPSTAIGAVYLRRTSDEIQALNMACPHAGCFIDFLPAREAFFCPCHNSAFALTGAVADPNSPSPRPMDSLPVEIRNGNEVWVVFQNFRAGTAQKIPMA